MGTTDLSESSAVTEFIDRFVDETDNTLFKESLVGLMFATRDIIADSSLTNLREMSAHKWCCLMRAIAKQMFNTKELSKFAPDEKLLRTLRNSIAMFLWFGAGTEPIDHPIRGVHAVPLQYGRVSLLPLAPEFQHSKFMHRQLTLSELLAATVLLPETFQATETEEVLTIHVNPQQDKLQPILASTNTPNVVTVVFTSTLAAFKVKELLLSSSLNVDVICFMAAPELMCLHSTDKEYRENKENIHGAFESMLSSCIEMYDATTTGPNTVLCSPLRKTGQSPTHTHTKLFSTTTP